VSGIFQQRNDSAGYFGRFILKGGSGDAQANEINQNSKHPPLTTH
jgi:hypothetical protein